MDSTSFGRVCLNNNLKISLCKQTKNIKFFIETRNRYFSHCKTDKKVNINNLNGQSTIAKIPGKTATSYCRWAKLELLQPAPATTTSTKIPTVVMSACARLRKTKLFQKTMQEKLMDACAVKPHYAKALSLKAAKARQNCLSLNRATTPPSTAESNRVGEQSNGEGRIPPNNQKQGQKQGTSQEPYAAVCAFDPTDGTTFYNRRDYKLAIRIKLNSSLIRPVNYVFDNGSNPNLLCEDMIDPGWTGAIRVSDKTATTKHNKPKDGSYQHHSAPRVHEGSPCTGRVLDCQIFSGFLSSSERIPLASL